LFCSPYLSCSCHNMDLVFYQIGLSSVYLPIPRHNTNDWLKRINFKRINQLDFCFESSCSYNGMYREIIKSICQYAIPMAYTGCQHSMFKVSGLFLPKWIRIMSCTIQGHSLGNSCVCAPWRQRTPANIGFLLNILLSVRYIIVWWHFSVSED
jgi:hypothetical protein